MKRDRINLCWKSASAGLFAMMVAVLFGGCDAGKSEVTVSNNYFIEASRAIGAGDTVKAMEALNASLDIKPSVWAYMERAKLNLQNGDQQAALADCQAALAISPEDRDVLWLQAEIKKPASKRFKGRFKTPPSHSK